MDITDFSRSFVRWSLEADLTDTRTPGHMPWGNHVRLQIDACCSIIDAAGAATDLFLIAPCRKEWMYRQTGLIMDPGAEYRAIFSHDRQIDVSMQARLNGDRPLPPTTEAFIDLAFEVSRMPARLLTTEEEVIEAVASDASLVASTLLTGANGVTARVEYPIRTLNYQPERGRFQVDTGPLILPILEELKGHPIDCCHLAHTVYNTLDYAEFTARPLGDAYAATADGVGYRSYSDLYQFSCRHQIFSATR